ncbi:hypothetical protein CTI12_AA443460 [Artemisia annua]|uniref:Uncharacterized protein n=1 Tax=Artemisia annua TaxID=35608 RepID=A0A2U1LX94_ARTAN|nr:hypothetical protein CTI12_AA443460 [Artemisia annua]
MRRYFASTTRELATRITISEFLNDECFKKGFKQHEFIEKEEADFNDVEAAFQDSKSLLSQLVSP